MTQFTEVLSYILKSGKVHDLDYDNQFVSIDTEGLGVISYNFSDETGVTVGWGDYTEIFFKRFVTWERYRYLAEERGKPELYFLRRQYIDNVDNTINNIVSASFDCSDTYDWEHISERLPFYGWLKPTKLSKENPFTYVIRDGRFSVYSWSRQQRIIEIDTAYYGGLRVSVLENEFITRTLESDVEFSDYPDLIDKLEMNDLESFVQRVLNGDGFSPYRDYIELPAVVIGTLQALGFTTYQEQVKFKDMYRFVSYDRAEQNVVFYQDKDTPSFRVPYKRESWERGLETHDITGILKTQFMKDPAKVSAWVEYIFKALLSDFPKEHHFLKEFFTKSD